MVAIFTVRKLFTIFHRRRVAGGKYWPLWTYETGSYVTDGFLDPASYR